MTPFRVILDTNVFVGAGFNPDSTSAQLLRAAERGHLLLVWNKATRNENRRVLTKVPRLSWDTVADLFFEDGRAPEVSDLAAYDFVEDPADRKFAALSVETQTPLVSSDAHLLAHRDRLDVWTPGAFARDVNPKIRARFGLAAGVDFPPTADVPKRS